MTVCLVTGGAGFIGSHVASALVDRGDQVRIFDNMRTGRQSNLDHLKGKVEVLQGDLVNRDEVMRAVEGVEVVYHQAALASVPRSVADPMATTESCVLGTVNLLDAARQAGARRVVYAASSSAYGDQPYSSKRESDLPMPLSPYAAAKLAGEYFCQAFTATYKLETVGLRYFNVFGPRQDPKSEYAAVIPKFVTLMLAGKQPTIFGDGSQSRDFTYIDNVVAGNLLAAKAPDAVGKTLNVACGGQLTLLQFVAAINRILGTNIEPIFENARTGDVRESLADITLARKLLGYEPTIGFDEGLKRSIEYYRGLGKNV